MVHEALVLEILDRFLKCNNVPLTCNVLLNGTRSATSGHRFQFRMLMRVCSSRRFGTLVSKLYFCSGEGFLLSLALRNASTALHMSAEDPGVLRCICIWIRLPGRLWRTWWSWWCWRWAMWDGPVVIRRPRGAVGFARTVAFIPRICTSQTSEHFLLREFVGTSKPCIGVFTVTFAFL